VFWHPWGGEEALVIQDQVAAFNAQNEFGISVTATNFGDNLFYEVQDGISITNLPNVTVGYLPQILSWQDSGANVVDLNPYIEDPNWGLSQEEKLDFYPEFWDQDVVNGTRFGFPAARNGAILFYNQTWAGELGFDSPPSTPTEFRAQACAAAAANVDGTGGWIASPDPATVMSWILASGEDGLTEAGHSYAFQSSKTENALEFIKGLFNSGCAWLPEEVSPPEVFTARQGLLMSGTIDQIQTLKTNPTPDAWTVLPYPGQSGNRVVNSFGGAFTIFESTPTEQLAAWIFIQWLSQPKNQAEFIEASGFLPTQKSTHSLLDDYAANNPEWAAACDLIPYSQSEPKFGSWTVGRWALEDAIRQLLDPEFSNDEIPVLLEMLDTLLGELDTSPP
jgi:ABC-type glycerol-3-phosphate transport system substrate-binding protein